MQDLVRTSHGNLLALLADLAIERSLCRDSRKEWEPTETSEVK
jgi:hypothetical protein